MKRRALLQHLTRYGCRLVREGGSHSIWENPIADRHASIPRHREIPDFTAKRICGQLGIPTPQV
ncbi:type II toxin-antitoxin system HicA family toxin [Planctomycetota bacterium]